MITDAFLITAKLAKLPAELAGYALGLSKNGIIGTIRDMFQLGTSDGYHPITDFGLTSFGLSGILIVILLINDVLMRKTPDETILRQKSPVLRWAGYYALIFAILLNWNWGSESSQFIYFTF